MPEWLLALIASSVVSGTGFTWKRISDTNVRVDKLEVRLAETYATKVELDSAFERVDKSLVRFENKLDALVMSELRTFREGMINKVSGLDESV